MTQAQNKLAAVDQRIADGKQADQAQTQAGPQTPDQKADQKQPGQDKPNEKTDQDDKKTAPAQQTARP